MNLADLILRLRVDGRQQANQEIDETTQHAQNASEKGNGALSKLGGVVVKVGTMCAKGVALCASGISTITGFAVNAYGEYEQLVGGVETLFGAQGMSIEQYAQSVGKTVSEVQGKYASLIKAQDNVMENAHQAYIKQGMSANEYMETVTSFSASLLQGLQGDTVEASKVADMAITDMADNANKMGTSMESIQNAYQGFSKQNYTMLDNLKLGYGGTKSEMERLLADAEKLTGVKYDINNLADVYNAIHAIQNNLGITGTTAKEAMETIQGAMNMTKASWENLMIGLSDGKQNINELANQFGTSFNTLVDNVFPRIQQAFQTIPQVLTLIIPQLLSTIISLLPTLLSAVGQLISGIAQALPSLATSLFGAVKTIFTMIVNEFTSGAPKFMESAKQMVSNLCKGIEQNLPNIISSALDMLLNFSQAVLDYAPQLVSMGMDLLVSLAKGIVNAIPTLIAKVPTIISNLANAFSNSASTILFKGIEIIVELGKGLIQAIPTLVANIPQIIKAIFDVWNAVNWWDLGKSLISGISKGIASLGGSLKSTVNNIFTNIADFIKNSLANAKDGAVNVFGNMGQLLKNIATGIWNGIKATFTAMRGGISGIFNGIKSLASTIWNGIKSSISNVVQAIKNTVVSIITSVYISVSSIFTNLSTGTSSIWNGIKNIVSSVVNGIKGSVSNAFSSLSGTVSSIWNGIKAAITNPISTAVSVVKGCIDKMKSAFNFTWSLPHLNLPHISVNGGVAPFGIGGKGSLPSFSVQWYKKAMDEPYILDKPTIFGQANNGQLLGGGESGQEVISGKQKLYDMIQEATNGGNEEILNVLKAIYARLTDDNKLHDILVQALSDGSFSVVLDNREVGRIVRKYA